MTQTLSLFLNLIAYSDTAVTNNPSLKDFDYARNLIDIPTSKSKNQRHVISPSEHEDILVLQRTVGLTSNWTIDSAEGVASKWVWSGIDPLMRIERSGSSLTPSSTLDIVRQGSSKIIRITFSDNIATGIIPGDELYLGSNSGVNTMNQGIFSIVSSGANWIEVIGSNMVNEVSVGTLNLDEIYIFSSGPVRVGDFVRINDPSFNYANRGEFQISKVTSRFFEIQNAEMVPEGPKSGDIIFYDQLYKMTYIETDESINVYINNSSEPLTIEPVQSSQGGLVGIFLWRGPVFSIKIENIGYSSANVTSFFCT